MRAGCYMYDTFLIINLTPPQTMKFDNDYQERLPEHPEPPELPAHVEEPVAAPVADSCKAAPVADVAAGRGGGSLIWAALAAVAIALFVGAIFFYSDAGRKDMEHRQYARSEAAVGTGSMSGNVAAVMPAVPAEPVQAAAGNAVAEESVEDVVYLFPLDGSDIKSDAALDKVARKVAASNGYVTVVAYTDESGRPEYNQRLSERRARKVGAYLVAHGVPASHVKTKGMGQTHAYPTAELDRRAVVHVEK